MLVKKKKGQTVKAYRLGEPHPEVDELIRQGYVVEKEEGVYEIYSQEAVNGSGQIGYKGDYLKIDQAGKPYPVKKEKFEKSHKKVEGDFYEQVSEIRKAWTVNEEESEEIKYLLKKKLIEIDEKNGEKYFHAFLWGAPLSAPKDAIVVFYKVERDENQEITEIDFNFVQYKEFIATYDIM